MTHLPMTPSAPGVSRPADLPPEAPAAQWRSLAGLRAEPATAIALVAVIVAAAHLVYLLADYQHVFVHPEWYFRLLPDTVRDGVTLSARDLVDALQPRLSESRPRWLMYFIAAVDQKLRFWLYQWGPVYPTLSPVAWLLQLLVAPVCLYRLLVELTRDRAAGLAGLAVYLSSIGFLSGFTMLFMPGKTLSNSIFMAALYAAAVATGKLRPGQTLAEAPGWSKYLVLVALFVGLFVDEMPLATFLIVPLVFWPQFLPILPRPARRSDLATRIWPTVKNGLFFALPGLAFLVVVLLIAPPLLRYLYDFHFDYLAETLGIGVTGSSLAVAREPLTLALVTENFTNLVGLSLAPYHLSPLIMSPFGDFPGSQVTNLPKALLLVGFFGVGAWAGWRARATFGWQILGLMAALVVFTLFLSLVMIRHIPIITGYYYGAGFSSLFALLVGLIVAGVSLTMPAARPLAALMALAIVGVQIVNYAPINDGWISTHNEVVTRWWMERLRSGLQRRIPLSEPAPLTRPELQGIWAAWERDRLDAYLREHKVSGAALYEVFELRELDDYRPRR